MPGSANRVARFVRWRKMTARCIGNLNPDWQVWRQGSKHFAERQAARGRRDFAEADRIRDALAAEGIVIDDTPQGARWRRR